LRSFTQLFAKYIRGYTHNTPYSKLLLGRHGFKKIFETIKGLIETLKFEKKKTKKALSILLKLTHAGGFYTPT
jgi:hypothetical protein